jgi:hypothetical protein
MLDFAESVLGKIRELRAQTHEKILSGSVQNMEQYKHLLGRLEAYNFVEDEVKNLLGENKEFL